MLHTFFALIFALTAVLSVALPNVAQAAASDFSLTLESDNGSLSAGDDFNISINMTNLSEGKIDNIKLEFLKEIIAYPENGVMTVIMSNLIAKGSPAEPLIPNPIQDIAANKNIKMKFIGDGSSGLMSVKITYCLDDVLQDPVVEPFYLGTEAPSTPEPPFDSTPYKPNLVASVADDATVTAGSYTGVKITIKNLSNTTYANDVTLTPTYDSTSPFNQAKVLTAMPITEIKTNGSVETTLSINADKYAAAGIYPFKFKLTCTNPWNDEYSFDQTVYIKIENNNKDTKLTLQTSSVDNISASAGKEFTMPVFIVNSGSFYAKDITVTLTDLSQDTFTLYSGAGQFVFDQVNGNANQKFDVKLMASKSLKSGSYPVSFKVEYTTEAGEKVSETQQIWLPVTGSGDSVNSLEVLEVKPSMTTVISSDVFDVSVKIKNSGTTKADQIKVSADGTSALLPVTQNLFIVPSLAPGETKTLTFKFQPSPDAQRGSVPIVIKVESLDGSGQNSTISQAVSVFVNAEGNTADPTKDVPKIIVGTYSYDPQLVKAGEKFTLSVSFINTHSSKTIRNIKGSFTVNETSTNQTGNVFTPVDSSNTFYIDKISPKGTYDWSLSLYTIPDALSKTYTVTISFDYEDEQGNPFKEDEIIGIPVYQPTRLEVSDISLPTEGYMGQPVYLPFTLYNMGKTMIYNVRMSVEGDFEAQPKSQYFGNYDPGYQEYVELNLMPMTVGTGNGKITVEYETTSGELQTYVKEFSMNVMDMPAMDPNAMPVDGGKFPMDPGMNGGEPVKSGGGFIGSLLFFIILGVVVVAVVIIIVVVKKRKKDKEFEF